MRILVIGGTGFISSRIVEKLLAAGHEVTSFTRGKSTKNFKKKRNLLYEFGDRHDEIKMKEIAAKNFDAVYDMIAYEAYESELMTKIFKEKTGHFIHCSTISVYMISNDVTCPITEDQWQAPAMDYDPRNPFGMDYGINKRKCEEILWENYDEKKFPVTILRPTFVSGPFGSWQ
jgi:nucleoside-diphosphate-sugar epimerase